MKTNVTLQPMMSFSKVPMIILLIVGLIFVVLTILLCLFEKRKKKANTPEIVPVTLEKYSMDDDAKPRYIGKLALLEERYRKGECDTREAYLKMSDLIRSFVQEATGVNVLNMSLSDFQHISMPELEDLMKEYYSPEFSSESIGDVLQSIAKTKKAIAEWK